jgi:DNA (cytosine-5)-methyltransferase 1
MGYHRAGFNVIGVDNLWQYSFPFNFYESEALEYLHRNGRRFDAIHASPPCQHYSAMNRAVKAKHPDLISLTRFFLNAIGKPWVIENVEHSPMQQPIMLCGTMFGLKTRRHRWFETSFPPSCLLPPCQCRHGVRSGRLVGHRVAGKVAPGRTQPPPATEADRREAIGVPWMNCRQARQAIPPAYTKWIGQQLMAVL